MAINRIVIKDRHGNVIASDSFASLKSVNVNVEGDTGTPSAEASYENGVLGILFRNIRGVRGNGISSITPVSVSTEDDGVSIYRITCEDGDTYDLEVRNGSKGSQGIQGIQGEKGDPFTYEDFTPAQLEALKVKGDKGDKGDQGDSAVYNPEDPDTPDFVMANTTGQSTTKAMTQKAVTDAITDNYEKSFGISRFLGAILTTGQFSLNKDNFTLLQGIYMASDGVVQYKTGGGFNVHSCISFDITEFGITKIGLKNGYPVTSNDASNLLYEVNGTIYSAKIQNNQSVDLSAIPGRVYLNFFSISSYPDTEFILYNGDVVQANLPKIQIEGEKAIESTALYKELGVTLDKHSYIKANGDAQSSDFWRSSDYIPVVKGDVISYRLNSQADTCALIAFYDSSKHIVSEESVIASVTGITESTVVVPEGVYYMRCGCNYSSNYDASVNKTFKTCYCIINSLLSTKKVLNELSASVSEIASHIAQDSTRLFDSIKKPIVFSDRKLVAFGDSITYGVCSPNLGNAGENKYISLFCAAAGCTLDNRAVSGQCIVPGQNGNGSIYNRVTTFTGTADIIWIAGGVNDWQTQSPIGTLADADSSTLYGALNGMCAYLKANYPNAIVIFVTPIPTTSTTTFDVEHPDNLNLYRKAIQEVAAVNGYNVINGDGLALPNSMTDYGNAMFDSSDRVHPTLAGHRLYANSLCGKLL